MNTASHFGSLRNAGLLRAHVLAFFAWQGAKEEMATFLDGLSVEVQNPEKETVNDSEEDSAPSVVQYLNGEIKADGVKLRRGGMFVSFPKAQGRYREIRCEISDARQIMNDTMKKITRNLGKDADKAIERALLARGYRPPVSTPEEPLVVNAIPQKGA